MKENQIIINKDFVLFIFGKYLDLWKTCSRCYGPTSYYRRKPLLNMCDYLLQSEYDCVLLINVYIFRYAIKIVTERYI